VDIWLGYATLAAGALWLLFWIVYGVAAGAWWTWTHRRQIPGMIRDGWNEAWFWTFHHRAWREREYQRYLAYRAAREREEQELARQALASVPVSPPAGPAPKQA
jgi:hypothetical protein